MSQLEFDFSKKDTEAETEEEGEDERQPTASPYSVLGVGPDASPSQVRLAYHRQVREHPPERDPEGFKRIREAYETLRSPRKRAELSLLELRQGPAEFDLDRLRDTPPPPLPERFADHLLAAVLAEMEAAIDEQVARDRQDGVRPGNGHEPDPGSAGVSPARGTISSAPMGGGLG